MTPSAPLDWIQIRGLARSLNLPGIHEDMLAGGDPCLKAHGRLWTWWDRTENAPGFRLPDGEREFLIASDPDIFFITPGEPHYSHVLARPDRVSWRWVLGNLSLSWRVLAPRSFVQLFPGEGPPVPRLTEH